ncbi:1,2-dihydroxycyclohexa-3,5-diene-1-carboxylate dehydrogenase [Pseudonocardia sediminis]|uniref:1,2-dihydroxycyclohexa-3,5-diene-1-carboxylate dehydrogenase n=1 Tax=Pseudonocardia sediminis TaxID=1397368 RepID=A0A4Q7UU49_PSEST|nr:benzoate 1,2-dioxygenase electron transfer component BenC [Pseudonocardia sediminis]RZT83543.1 1,2-dihydroxycyclohexa-3,5-diene-1-carboxylate dehydrogenase [Pseudonocardia sediminis]
MSATATTHKVALSFEDGVTRFVNCKEGQSIADASYRSRINIPVDCSDGACGTCKAFCESGEYDGGSYIEDALSDDESEQGYLLACQAKPRSDMVVQIATTSAVAKTSAATHKGTVTALDRLSSSTVALTIEIQDRDKLAYLPGQYVNIAVPGTDDTRSYSFSSGPDDEALTFLIKITPGGVMSEYLDSRAKVGDDIELTGPHGSFFLRESDAPLLLLAGGTGLAPILAILRTLDAAESTRPMHLLYGATTDDDVVELDTVRALADSIDGLTWDYCVADENTSCPNQGYVTALIEESHLHDGDAAVYLCGPPPMVEAVRGFFSEQDYEPSGFYYEKFALAAKPDDEAGEKADPEPQAVEREDGPGTESSAGGTRVSAETEDGPVSETVVAIPSGDGSAEDMLTLGGREGRAINGREVLHVADLEPLYGTGRPESVGSENAAWRINGQMVFSALDQGEVTESSAGGTSIRTDLDPDDGLIVGAGRNILAQELLPVSELEPLTAPAAPGPETPAVTDDTVSDDGYVIGEEHPSIDKSDAIFDARRALELGALELTVGRLSNAQIAGYRLLAESTVPYVDVENERFTDAHGYTETNAAFHDYLFTLTRNEHLLRAYQALGVKGAMEETLRNAVWCHPSCAQDHLDIVDAFESGEKDVARQLISDHAERSKETMRRAMRDTRESRRPRFVTPGRFAGQVVLVTGAGQGIGERAARRIGAEDGTLVLADRADTVHDLASELGQDGCDALSVTADLETWEGAQAVVDAAIERYGRIDVAIHTVGGTIWAKPFEHYPPEQIQAEINRSLWPTMWCCRAVVPHMIERGGGTIVNVSSVATRGLNRLPYAAAKGGVNAITAALALEMAPHGVRVVATAPGGTDAPPRKTPRGPAPESEQEQDWYRTIVDQTTESSLLKRYGTLDEQASAITFLASEEASYITGTVLPVAGGDLG